MSDTEAYEKWACTLTKVPTAWEAWQVVSNKAIESLASWMLMRGFSTGHGDTIDDLLAELDGQIHQQPAVPDEKKRYSDSPYEGGYADGWNACRKVLLSAGKENNNE